MTSMQPSLASACLLLSKASSSASEDTISRVHGVAACDVIADFKGRTGENQLRELEWTQGGFSFIHASAGESQVGWSMTQPLSNASIDLYINPDVLFA